MTIEKWFGLGLPPDAMSFHPAFQAQSIRFTSPLRPVLARAFLSDPSAHPEGRRLSLRDVSLYLTVLDLIERNGSTDAAEIVEAIEGRLSIKAVQAELEILLEQDFLCPVPEQKTISKCRPISSWNRDTSGDHQGPRIDGHRDHPPAVPDDQTS